MGDRSEDAVEQLLAELRQMKEVQAVLRSGSTLDGDAASRASIDLFVVLHEQADWWQIASRRHGAIAVEVHFAPARAWLRRLEAKSPAILNAFATGRIIHGSADELVDLARRLWGEGPEPLTAEAVDGYRAHLTDLAEDLEELTGLSEEERYVGTLLLDQVLEAYCKLHRLWGEKPKRRLAYVERQSPEVGRLAREFLRSGNPAWLQDLVDSVLAPYGGRLSAYERERRRVE